VSTADDAGDLGGGSTLSERRLEERAIRERWPMSEPVRVAILRRLAGILDVETEEGAKAKLRHVIQAARTLIAADSLNLRQQLVDLAREKLDSGDSEWNLSQIVAEAERIALEHTPATRPTATTTEGAPT
jgi:hypothetical protein